MDFGQIRTAGDRTSPTNYNNPIHGSGAGEIYSVVQGTEQVLPTAMIRYMVVVLGDSLPPHERRQRGLAWVMSHL